MATPAEPGNTPRSADARAIGVWLGLLGLVALVVMAWQGRARQAPTAPPGPWLDAPAGGMDVSQWASRQWLRTGHLGGIGDGLADHCGHDAALPRERYAASLPGTQGDDGWRLIIDMGPTIARVTATRDAGARLAPDAALQTRSATTTVARPRAFSRDQLEEVRRAWRSPRLWAAPVSDGPDDPSAPVVLEACVDGLYAVRLRRASADATKLAAALDTLLAPPAPR